MSTLDHLYGNFSTAEKRTAVDNWVMNNPASNFHLLKEEPQWVRDTGFEIVVMHSKIGKIAAIYETGVSPAAYSHALSRTADRVADENNEYRWSDMRTLDALVKLENPQPLPESAGPIAKLLKTLGMPETAMTVTDIDQGFAELPMGRPIFLVSAFMASAMATDKIMGQDNPNSGKVSLCMFALATSMIVRDMYRDALWEGKAKRLVHTAYGMM